MRRINSSIYAQRICLALCLLLVSATPLRVLAQDAEPAAEPVAEEPVAPVVAEVAAPEIQDAPVESEAPVQQQEPVAPAAPAPGAVEISLYGTNGVALSGTFAVSDASGNYREVWIEGVATIWELAPGEASITQVSGTTDYGFGSPATSYVSIPAGAITGLQVVNVFMDADSDGIGDSQDVCAAGNDAVDTDLDGLADACDSTPNGDDDGDGVDNAEDSTPTGDDDGDGVDNALDLCATGDDAIDQDGDGTADACDDTPGGEETSTLQVEVVEDTIVLGEAPVSCKDADAATPWVASDLDDYPPGGLVTLTGGSWVPGQTVELFVDDDGIADAEKGPWSHAATVTADEAGAFTYEFTLAPWFVANYTVVATGECSEARTAFTDSVTGGNCVQVSTSDVVTAGQYVMFRCESATNPIRIGVTSISAGWQWAYIFSGSTTPAAPAYSSLSWNTSGTASDSSASGNNNQAYFFLSPIAGTLPAATGSVTVQIKNPSGNAVNYTSSLTSHRTVATSDFSLSCTPTSFTAPVPGTQTVTCSLSAINIAPNATVTASIPAITAPTGWTVTSPNPATGIVKQGAPFVFSFTFTSSCTASPAIQTVSVLSTLTNTSQSLTGPSTSVDIARASSTAVSAAISSSSLTWNRSYAFTPYSTNSGSLTYSVQAAGCSGWNVTIAASPFVSAGSATTIPAANLTLTSSSSSGGTGISAPVSSGSLNSSLKVLSASASNGNGSFTQTLNINLNIPGGTLVGTYTSTLTIAAASGP